MTKINFCFLIRLQMSATFKKQMTIEKQKLEFAIKLTELRKSSGMTQEELANKIGKPQSIISKIESGEMNPTIELVIEIVNGLGKDFDPSFE